MFGTTYSGPASSVNALAANQMPDNEKVLFLLYPYQTPLFQKLYFSEGHRAEPVVNDQGLFSWFEDELYPHFTTITGAGIAGGATANIYAVVSNTGIFQPNDIYLVEATQQMVYVSAALSAATITIATLDGTNVLAAASGAIRKIGVLDHEFAGARTAVATTEVQVSNYLTKFNESVGITGRQDASKQFTNGKDFKSQLQKKVKEMKLMYERNFKFSTAMGKKAVTGSDGGTYNATYGMGFLGRVTTNKVSYTVMTEDALDNYFATVFNTGGANEKDHYSGANQTLAFQKIVKAKYNIDPKPYVTEYGVNLTKYRLPFGTVNMIFDPTMDNVFSDYGFTVDTSADKPVKLRYMADDSSGSRKFRVTEHVETRGTDGRIDKILADIGIEIPNQEIHGMLYLVQ